MRRRPRGLTLVELAVGAAMAALLGLVVFAYLSSGFNFALAAQEHQAVSTSLRAAVDRVAHLAQQARGHRVYQDYSRYQAGNALNGGAAGRCLRLYLPTETWVVWYEPSTSRLLAMQEGNPRGQVLARDVTDFQARCSDRSQVWLRLDAATASASDVRSPIFYSTTVYLRNYDGSADSCEVLLPWGGA